MADKDVSQPGNQETKVDDQQSEDKNDQKPTDVSPAVDDDSKTNPGTDDKVTTGQGAEEQDDADQLVAFSENLAATNAFVNALEGTDESERLENFQPSEIWTFRSSELSRRGHF